MGQGWAPQVRLAWGHQRIRDQCIFSSATQFVIPAIDEGQSPQDGTFPSYAQVSEDLHILSKYWQYLRLYDCSRHAETVLEVISTEKMDFRVMLGANMQAEMSNQNCPWGAQYSDETLNANRQENSAEVDRLIRLAIRYPEIVFSVSVGNEATVEWTDHMVPVEKLVEYVRRIRSAIGQPVTFCENYVPWTNKLGPLAAELDFISLHTYPVWEYQSVEAALDYTKMNYYSVADHYQGSRLLSPRLAGPHRQTDEESSPGTHLRNCRRSTTGNWSTGPRKLEFSRLFSKPSTNRGKALRIRSNRRSIGGSLRWIARPSWPCKASTPIWSRPSTS